MNPQYSDTAWKIFLPMGGRVPQAKLPVCSLYLTISKQAEWMCSPSVRFGWIINALQMCPDWICGSNITHSWRAHVHIYSTCIPAHQHTCVHQLMQAAGRERALSRRAQQRIGRIEGMLKEKKGALEGGREGVGYLRTVLHYTACVPWSDL